MYYTDFLDDDWNAEFLSEVVPLNSQKKPIRRFESTDSDGGFHIEPGTLPDKIAKRKQTRIKIKNAETTVSRPPNRHRAKSIKLREKENRLAAMEAALRQEREQLKKEREELEAAKRKSSLSVDKFEEFRKSHEKMQSFMSELDEDDEILRELGFVVDTDNFDVLPTSEFSSHQSEDDNTESSEVMLEMQLDAEDMNVRTLDILKQIHAMERELEESPFMSFSGGAEVDALDGADFSEI